MGGWRVRGAVGVLLGVGVAAGWGQAAPGEMQFEVASVRQSRSEAKPTSNFSLDNGNVFTAVGSDTAFVPKGGVFAATNMPLVSYLAFAYRLSGTQMLALRFREYLGPVGELPKWATEERFDIQARAGREVSKDEMRAMLRTLLEERFALKVHREERQVGVLALEPAGKPGSAIKAHAADDRCEQEVAGLPRVCGVLAHTAAKAPGWLSFGGRDVSMAVLAGSLVTQAGIGALRRPVVDRTGMAGGYDLRLDWVQGDGEVSGPTLEAALREQLGLKLVAEKGAVEVLVVDHVEEPTAN